MPRSPAYLRVLYSVLLLQSFGAYAATVAMYGGQAALFKRLLLGHYVGVHMGTLYITDREVWEAEWVNNAWVHYA